MAVKNGVEVLDQKTFEWTQCIIRNREPTEFKLASVAVNMTPVSSEVNLNKLIKIAYPWLNSNFSSITIANQEALMTSDDDNIWRQQVKDIYLLSPNKKYLIRISGPAQGKVLNLALSTFVFK